jgi:hypothetical protein
LSSNTVLAICKLLRVPGYLAFKTSNLYTWRKIFILNNQAVTYIYPNCIEMHGRRSYEILC